MNVKSWSEVDEEIIKILEEEGVEFICGLPCLLLKGIINRIGTSGIKYIPVTREEEAVGICAGLYLGGKKAIIIMQNSGLGNSINALLSLTRLYGMPLLLMLSHRGAAGEKIEAQVPMGRATPKLLEALGIGYLKVVGKGDLAGIRDVAGKAFKDNELKAILLSRSLWYEKD